MASSADTKTPFMISLSHPTISHCERNAGVSNSPYQKVPLIVAKPTVGRCRGHASTTNSGRLIPKPTSSPTIHPQGP